MADSPPTSSGARRERREGRRFRKVAFMKAFRTDLSEIEPLVPRVPLWGWRGAGDHGALDVPFEHSRRSPRQYRAPAVRFSDSYPRSRSRRPKVLLGSCAFSSLVHHAAKASCSSNAGVTAVESWVQQAFRNAPTTVTVHTVAPEIARNWPTGQTASAASDVYSLGATAYWLLAGRTAHDFAGVPDLAAAMGLVAGTEPRRLRDAAPHLPSAVARVVERAMARTTADRYQSATEFAAALGSRTATNRRWRRTDEHAGHIACWRGKPRAGGGTYVVCLEQGARQSQCVITSRHAASGGRITRGCRTAAMRDSAQAVRAVMTALG